ncbi:MAG: hypothetical protein AAGB19_13980 [Cyanobacteria bacterium P01_F01_bin.3]
MGRQEFFANLFKEKKTAIAQVCQSLTSARIFVNRTVSIEDTMS